jgi:hypothetical protein
MNQRPGVPTQVVVNLWGQLAETFRRHPPESQGDFDRQGHIIESAYNSITANLSQPRAAAMLAPAMEQLEQHARMGGWNIADRLLPIADDCRRARRS